MNVEDTNAWKLADRLQSAYLAECDSCLRVEYVRSVGDGRAAITLDHRGWVVKGPDLLCPGCQ